MRIDLLKHGIKVSEVRPGMVETEFSVVRFHGDKERADKVYEGVKPLCAADIAEVIGWIVSLPPQYQRYFGDADSTGRFSLYIPGSVAFHR